MFIYWRRLRADGSTSKEGSDSTIVEAKLWVSISSFLMMYPHRDHFARTVWYTSREWEIRVRYFCPRRSPGWHNARNSVEIFSKGLTNSMLGFFENAHEPDRSSIVHPSVRFLAVSTFLKYKRTLGIRGVCCQCEDRGHPFLLLLEQEVCHLCRTADYVNKNLSLLSTHSGDIISHTKK